MSPSKNNSGPELRGLELKPDALRWTCPPDWLPFDTTEHVEPLAGVVGQEEALEALRFGLEMIGPGQNIFVRGLSGSGRLTLVCQLIEEMRPMQIKAPTMRPPTSPKMCCPAIKATSSCPAMAAIGVV